MSDLLDSVNEAAVKLLAIATAESEKTTLTERTKLFEAVAAWAKTQLAPATKEPSKANGKYRDLRAKFHDAGPRRRASPETEGGDGPSN